MNIFEIAMEKGMEKGIEKKLISLVCKKIQKGKNIITIADELEEEEQKVQRIYDVAIQFAPEYNEDEIYNKLLEVK